MEELMGKIDETFAAFKKDADKGNKASERRARKASTDLSKLMKKYRDATLACDKTTTQD